MNFILKRHLFFILTFLFFWQHEYQTPQKRSSFNDVVWSAAPARSSFAGTQFPPSVIASARLPNVVTKII